MDATHAATAGLTIAGEGPVLTWTIDRPARRNAITPDALRYIAARCPTLSGEIVVLRGAGDEAFCAGFDLTALEDPEPRPPGSLPDEPLIAATAAMRHANATFVAAIGGYAIGAGVELLCACDLRIARQDVWFQVPAARLGVVYHADGVARMRAVFGGAAVARLLLLGRRVNATAALAAGALVELVARDRFEDEVASVVEDLQRAAPQSLAGNRTVLRALGDATLPEPFDRAHAGARAAAYGSEDHSEARQALAQRRPPRFTGR